MTIPAAGDPAPDFSLDDTDGNSVNLADLRGRKVVLYFYSRDDTPGCVKEACGFRDNLARVTSQGALVYGISADDVASHRKFTDKYELNFPLLADTDKEVVQAYGVWVEKTRFGRKSMGIQRATFLIDEQGVITRVWPNVNPEGHADEVIKALAA